MQVRIGRLQEKLSEERLGAVSCLKGGLMEEIEDQNSLIVSRGSQLIRLEIELDEARLTSEHFRQQNRELVEELEKERNERQDEDRVDCQDDLVKLKEQNTSLLKELEVSKKNIISDYSEVQVKRLQQENQGLLEELEKSKVREESFNDDEDPLAQMRENLDNERQRMDLMHKKEITQVSFQFHLELRNLTLELEEKIETISELEKYIEKLEVNLNTLAKEKKVSEESLQLALQEERKESGKILEDVREKLDVRDAEVEKLTITNDNNETIQNQVQQITDVYENKIETLTKSYNNNKENIEIDNKDLKAKLEDKNILIGHLKTDLQSITRDIENRTIANSSQLQDDLNSKNKILTEIEEQYDQLTLKYTQGAALLEMVETEKNAAIKENSALKNNILVKNNELQRTSLEIEKHLDSMKTLKTSLQEKEADNFNMLEKVEEEYRANLQTVNQELTETKDLYTILSEKLANKESECYKLQSKLKAATESLPNIEVSFRRREDSLKDQLTQQTTELEVKGQELEKLLNEQKYLEDKVGRGEERLRQKEEVSFICIVTLA